MTPLLALLNIYSNLQNSNGFPLDSGQILLTCSRERYQRQVEFFMIGQLCESWKNKKKKNKKNKQKKTQFVDMKSSSKIISITVW